MQNKEKKPSNSKGDWGFTVWGDWRTIVIVAVCIALGYIATRNGLTPDQIAALIGVAIKKVFGL